MDAVRNLGAGGRDESGGHVGEQAMSGGEVVPSAEYAPSFGEPVSPWFRWFAWRPVETVDRGWRWLRPVWRRRVHKHQYLDGGADWWFQHAVRLSSPPDITSGGGEL